jgi:NitT/TauT family transport system permease protein
MSRAGALRLAIVALAVGALELLCRVGAIAPQVIVAPSRMAATLVSLVADGAIAADLARTVTCVLASFVLAVLAGFAAGAVIHALPRLRAALDPLLATYYAVPFFVFYPVLVALLGLTLWPVIAIAFMFAVVAMVMATLDGLDRVPRVLPKVARVHRLGRLDAALRITLPASAPSLFTGIKLAVAYAFIGTIASEFILSGAGLGYAIAYAYNSFETAKMYALMLFIVVVVTAVNLALYAAERRLARRWGR